jgi:hypothetical protein
MLRRRMRCDCARARSTERCCLSVRSSIMGSKVEIVDCAEGLFDETAAAESPGGSDDFGGEDFFEGAIGGEFAPERLYGVGVFVFFAFADEVVGGEEAVFVPIGGVAAGDGQRECCGRAADSADRPGSAHKALVSGGRRSRSDSDDIVAVGQIIDGQLNLRPAEP